MSKYQEFVGFDLDGTLAKRPRKFDINTVGAPIPSMVARLKKHLNQGDTVKIFTARASTPGAAGPIQKWLKANGLPKLDVTNVKTPGMKLLYDDKAIGVVPDKGVEKSAARMAKKTRTVEETSQHCPHCDFEFREKCYPKRINFEGEFKDAYDSGEYDDACPACGEIIDQDEPEDSEIENRYVGGFWGDGSDCQHLVEAAKKRRDAQRRRRQEREQEGEPSRMVAKFLRKAAASASSEYDALLASVPASARAMGAMTDQPSEFMGDDRIRRESQAWRQAFKSLAAADDKTGWLRPAGLETRKDAPGYRQSIPAVYSSSAFSSPAAVWEPSDFGRYYGPYVNKLRPARLDRWGIGNAAEGGDAAYPLADGSQTSGPVMMLSPSSTPGVAMHELNHTMQALPGQQVGDTSAKHIGYTELPSVLTNATVSAMKASDADPVSARSDSFGLQPHALGILPEPKLEFPTSDGSRAATEAMYARNRRLMDSYQSAQRLNTVSYPQMNVRNAADAGWRYMYGKDPKTRADIGPARSMQDLLSTTEGQQWLKRYGTPLSGTPGRVKAGRSREEMQKQEGDTKPTRTTVVELLRRAKERSDAGDYSGKHALVRGAMVKGLGEFRRDSTKDRFAGITHEPSGFRIHVPSETAAGLPKRASVMAALRRARNATHTHPTKAQAGYLSAVCGNNLFHSLYKQAHGKVLLNPVGSGSSCAGSRALTALDVSTVSGSEVIDEFGSHAGCLRHYAPSVNTLMSKRASAEASRRKARNETHTHPTPEQAAAGNYRHGSMKWKGLCIKIENPEGSTRRGVSKSGKAWATVMQGDYGYFAGVRSAAPKGPDNDPIDVFVGPNLDSDKVAVVDQTIEGKFDEHKVVIGCDSEKEAVALYLSNYDKGWKVGPVTMTDVAGLKAWLASGETKEPFNKIAYTYTTRPKAASPRWVKMLASLSAGARKELANSLPATTRQVGKVPIGYGSEGEVFDAFTGGGVGDSVVKKFYDLLGRNSKVPNKSVTQQVEGMRAFPDVFATVHGTNPVGYAMERLHHKLPPGVAGEQDLGPLLDRARKYWGADFKMRGALRRGEAESGVRQYARPRSVLMRANKADDHAFAVRDAFSDNTNIMYRGDGTHVVSDPQITKTKNPVMTRALRMADRSAESAAQPAVKPSGILGKLRRAFGFG